MRKLISAGFFSLFRSKRFWVGGAAMLAFCLSNLWEHIQIINRWNETVATETVLFDFPSMIMFVVPVVAALHINTDYHDGTIRNKITVGCSRAQIYLANLVVLSAVSLFYILLYVTPVLAVGIPLFGWPVSTPQEVVSHLLTCALVALSATAVHTLLASLISSRSVLLVTIFAAFAMMIGSLFLSAHLEAPETILEYDSIVYISDQDGNMVMQYLDKDGNPIPADQLKEIPNPAYVSEPLRSVYGAIIDLNPGGQSLQLMGSTERRSPDWLLMLNAAGLTAALTGLGLALFRRKDLK